MRDARGRERGGSAVDNLRPYQRDAIHGLREAYRSHRSVLLVLPTGAGKTRVASWIMRRHAAEGGRVLFLVHRTELVRQTVATLASDGCPSVRVIAATEDEGAADAPIIVASVQTLLARDLRPEATLVICDEAHHYVSAEWVAVVREYASARILGLTATPERSDGRPLGDLFEHIVAPTSIAELTRLGHLVPSIVYAPAKRRTALAAHPHEALLERRLEWTRAVVFCANVDHAHEVAAKCSEAGLRAACIHGDSDADERASVLARFRAGELDVVTNVFVLTEGYDDGGIDCAVIARGCGSAGTYLQIVGRVIRTAPGKTHAIVLDLVGAVHEHGLPDAAREYALEGKAIRPGATVAIRQCLACGAAYEVGPRVCPRCGAGVPPPPKPRMSREELARVMSSHTPDRRAQEWQRLQATARARGYSAGWAWHRYRVMYGGNPPR